MTFQQFKKAWANKWHILNALFTLYFSFDQGVRKEMAKRLKICKSNKCGYWDATGKSETLIIKGKPGCTGCGCMGLLKTACMDCHCSLKELGGKALWEEYDDTL